MITIILLYLFSNLVFTLAIKNIMDVFFEASKTSFRVITFSYVLYFILASIERIFFNEALSHLLIILPALFIISLNYESSTLKRLVAVSTNYVLFSVIAVISADLISMLPNSINNLVNSYYIGQYMSASLFSFLASLLFKRFKNIRKNDISIPSYWIFVLLIMLPAIPFILFYSSSLSIFMELSIMFFFIGINLLVFYLYDALSVAYEANLQAVLNAKEKEYYLSQCHIMQESLDNINSFRHDMKFHLVTLMNYTTNDKIPLDYLNNLISTIDQNEIYSETGNIAFDSIINYKLNFVKEYKIALDININIPSSINIEVVDIVTILGNLLDNALNAVVKVEKGFIRLNIQYQKNNIFIKIDNNFNGSIDYEENILVKEKTIKTSKTESVHGYGLKNVRKSVEKYNGYLDISHTEGLFSVGVLLYCE